MAHSHHHGHHHGGHEIGNIRVAFFLNLAFTLLEFGGGIWTNSVAIMADAVHDLGDSVALGLAWYLERFARRGASPTFSYGYGRFSLLGALINAGVLIGGSLLVLAQAIPRLLAPEPTYVPGMIGFALLGILFNGAAVLRMRGSSGLNARVVSWHLLEDMLGWVAVLIVSLVIALGGGWYWLDPLLSVAITLVVLFNTVRNLRGVLRILLQATPEQIDLDAIDRRLQAIPQVESTHHTHMWSLDGEHHVLTTHLIVGAEASKDTITAVKTQARALATEAGAEHLTVEVEYADEDCVMRTRGHSHDDLAGGCRAEAQGSAG